MRKEYGWLFKTLRIVLRISTPSYSILDQRSERQKESGSVVYVSHHQNLFGPIIILTWYPEFLRTWIYNVFLEFETCYHHYIDFTFTERLGWNPILARVIAWPATLLAVTLTQSSCGIPVYRKSRSVITTLKQSVHSLMEDNSILVFPDVEYDDKSSSIKDIYEGFLSIEKYYFRETGQHVSFVPIFVDRNKKEIRISGPIQFEGKQTFFIEKKQMAIRIQQALNLLSDANRI